MSVPPAGPSTSPAGTRPPDAGTATRVTLAALVTVATIESVRASGPALDRAFTAGTPVVAAAALVTYLGAGLLAAAALLATGRRATGTASGRTVLALVSALGVARLAAQATQDLPRFLLVLLTASLAVAALVMAVTFVAGRTGGGRQAAIGLSLGIGMSTALQLALGTWDPLWRGGVLGTLVAVALVGATVAVAWVVRREVPPRGRPRRTWGLGLALAVVVMMLADPAFAASQSGVALLPAGAALVLASAGTVWLLLVPRVLVPWVRVLAAVALPVATAVAFLLPDPGALLAVVVAQPAAGVVLASALSTRRSAPPGVVRTAISTAGTGLGLVAVLLVYLLDYDVPLGFDNAWVVVVAAALVAGTGLRWPTPEAVSAGEPAPPLRANALRLLVLPSVVLLLVGWWADASGPGIATDRAASDELVVLDWNLHYGVAADTAVDLEQIARTIEAEDPDVVTVQEVARGWVLGGGVDMATWLGDRLGMYVEFAPAADRQFGNLLLSRTPLTDVQVIELPYGDGPQQRSALTAVVETSAGTPVRVTSVHLQHRDDNTGTRLAQLDALAAALPDDGPSVLAGDLNAELGSPELDALDTAGWISAIDTAGDPDVLTHPSDDPTVRIDWVLGRGVTFTDARVLTDESSDHRPVVTRVTVG
ncbi:MAG TPA: endonuclease/exonuclease/phosphatase family protein [Cellulomonas sp.]